METRLLLDGGIDPKKYFEGKQVKTYLTNGAVLSGVIKDYDGVKYIIEYETPTGMARAIATVKETISIIEKGTT